MKTKQTNNTSKQEQLIAELHKALNAVTALFVWVHGFEYECIEDALRVLEKSGRLYKLPVREALAKKIDGNNQSQQQ